MLAGARAQSRSKTPKKGAQSGEGNVSGGESPLLVNIPNKMEYANWHSHHELLLILYVNEVECISLVSIFMVWSVKSKWHQEFSHIGFSSMAWGFSTGTVA